MKRIIIYSVVLMMGLSSCDDFLKEKAYSFLTPDNFYNNEKDAIAALNAVFSVMQPQGFYQRTVYVVSENAADLLYATAGNSDRNTLTDHTFTNTNGEISKWYVGNYSMIKNANDVIKYVPGINMNETRRNLIVGNACFLRAMGYFSLVQAFGDVPLITGPVTVDDPQLYPSKAPASEIYKLIIADLEYAERYCPPEKDIISSEKGRVSTGAASALLAKVYLTRAKTSFAESGDSEKALEKCNKVLADNSYELLPAAEYAGIFSSDNKYNKEIVFAVRFGTAPNTSNITLRMFYPTVLGGYGSFCIQEEFFNNGYESADDVRKGYSISDKAVQNNGTVTDVAPFCYKFRDSQWKEDNNSRTDWFVLRFAEVYLLQSEAVNNINPADANKFSGINIIRQRAGLTDVRYELNMTNTPDSKAFEQALLDERARELCCEGQRRWDLIRFGKLKEAMAKVGVTVDDNHILFPFPQSETDVNPNL
jgi:hypothetical protein